jgi:hypothetical protein
VAELKSSHLANAEQRECRSRHQQPTHAEQNGAVLVTAVGPCSEGDRQPVNSGHSGKKVALVDDTVRFSAVLDTQATAAEHETGCGGLVPPLNPATTADQRVVFNPFILINCIILINPFILINCFGRLPIFRSGLSFGRAFSFDWFYNGTVVRRKGKKGGQKARRAVRRTRWAVKTQMPYCVRIAFLRPDGSLSIFFYCSSHLHCVLFALTLRRWNFF